MIIARCESLIAGKPISDAIKRCFAYVEAGVDGIMIHSKEITCLLYTSDRSRVMTCILLRIRSSNKSELINKHQS